MLATLVLLTPEDGIFCIFEVKHAPGDAEACMADRLCWVSWSGLMRMTHQVSSSSVYFDRHNVFQQYCIVSRICSLYLF